MVFKSGELELHTPLNKWVKRFFTLNARPHVKRRRSFCHGRPTLAPWPKASPRAACSVPCTRHAHVTRTPAHVSSCTRLVLHPNDDTCDPLLRSSRSLTGQEHELSYYLSQKEHDVGGGPAEVIDLRKARVTARLARHRQTGRQRAAALAPFTPVGRVAGGKRPLGRPTMPEAATCITTASSTSAKKTTSTAMRRLVE